MSQSFPLFFMLPLNAFEWRLSQSLGDEYAGAQMVEIAIPIIRSSNDFNFIVQLFMAEL